MIKKNYQLLYQSCGLHKSCGIKYIKKNILKELLHWYWIIKFYWKSLFWINLTIQVTINFYPSVENWKLFPTFKWKINNLKQQKLFQEIYPKTLTEYSEMTDGACGDDDITRQELILLHRLNWLLWPVTSLCWLQMYVQLASVWVKERGVVTLNSSLASNQKESAKRLLVTIANVCFVVIIQFQNVGCLLRIKGFYEATRWANLIFHFLLFLPFVIAVTYINKYVIT